MQRRAPLYDASRQPEETVEQFRERRSHPRPGSQPRAENPSQPSQLSPSQLNHSQSASGRPVPNGQNGHNGNGFGVNGLNGAGHNGAAQPPPEVEVDPESMETTVIRTRREPFGPVTRSQAIIDLSARKRPRSPYSS